MDQKSSEPQISHVRGIGACCAVVSHLIILKKVSPSLNKTICYSAFHKYTEKSTRLHEIQFTCCFYYVPEDKNKSVLGPCSLG
ncbi:hypothetical protein STEG23_004461, partial [Scotinomys teguina]